MYSRISSNELITVATTPGNSEEQDVRNMDRFSLFGRKLVKMVKHVILTTEPVAKRREALLHFIHIVQVSAPSYNGRYEYLCADADTLYPVEMSRLQQLCISPLPHGWHYVRVPR